MCKFLDIIAYWEHAHATLGQVQMLWRIPTKMSSIKSEQTIRVLHFWNTSNASKIDDNKQGLLWNLQIWELSQMTSLSDSICLTYI